MENLKEVNTLASVLGAESKFDRDLGISRKHLDIIDTEIRRLKKVLKCINDDQICTMLNSLDVAHDELKKSCRLHDSMTKEVASIRLSIYQTLA